MKSLLLSLAFVLGCAQSVQVESPRDRTHAVFSSVVALVGTNGKAFCTGTMVHDHVLTAAHCVEEVGSSNEIGFYLDYVRAAERWSQTFTYKVVHVNDNATDLALLQVTDLGAQYVNAPLSPDLPVLGQTVFTIGHPVWLHYSLAVGAVTAPHRSIIDGSPFEWTQVDMGITPGNSGGPLLNEHGEVLGVCSFRLHSRSGGEPHLGGFVHIASVRRFLSQAIVPVAGR